MSSTLRIRRTTLIFVVCALLAMEAVYFAYFKNPKATEIAQREIDSLRTKNNELIYENKRLASDKQKYAEKIEQQQKISSEHMQLSPGNILTEPEPDGSIERVIQLKQALADHPKWGIPEMRLLTDQDWLAQVKDFPLDTEASERRVLSYVRYAAQSKFGQMAAAATKDYMAANSGQLPSSPGQLADYLPQRSDADLLQGLEKFDGTGPPELSPWIFQHKQTADEWYDSDYFIGENMFTARGNGAGWEVENAVTAFQQATGSAPRDPSEIVPYLRKTISQPTLNSIFQALRKTLDSPPVVPPNSGPKGQSGIGRL